MESKKPTKEQRMEKMREAINNYGPMYKFEKYIKPGHTIRFFHTFNDQDKRAIELGYEYYMDEQGSRVTKAGSFGSQVLMIITEENKLLLDTIKKEKRDAMLNDVVPQSSDGVFGGLENTQSVQAKVMMKNK